MNKRLSDNNKSCGTQIRHSKPACQGTKKRYGSHENLQVKIQQSRNQRLKKFITNNAKGQDFLKHLKDINQNIGQWDTTIRLLIQDKTATQSQLDKLQVSFRTLRGKNALNYGYNEVLKAM
jgi:hypothetical protein